MGCVPVSAVQPFASSFPLQDQANCPSIQPLPPVLAGKPWGDQVWHHRDVGLVGRLLLLLISVRWAPWTRSFRKGGITHLVLLSAHGSSVPMGTPSLPPTQPCSSLAGGKRNILFSWNTICSQIMYKTFAETTYSSCIFYESNPKLKYINIKISRSTLGRRKKKVIS